MLGRIVYRSGVKGRRSLEREELLGLRVASAELDPESFWYRGRLKKLGRLFRAAGVSRLLVPEEFDQWELLSPYGLREVEASAFLRAHAAPIAVAALEKRGECPQRCAVALRGLRADREMTLAAHALARRVREVCVCAPRGGEELGRCLRREYGLALCPDSPDVPAAVRFDASANRRGAAVLSLYAGDQDLAGVEIGLKDAPAAPLSLLCALWEAGKICQKELEFT